MRCGAAYLIPHHLVYYQWESRFASRKFGVPETVYVNNQHHKIEPEFDEGNVVIVPVDNSGSGARGKIRVMDKSSLDTGGHLPNLE